MTLIPNFAATNSSSMSMSTITSSVTDSTTSELALQSNRNIVTIGVSIAMLLILSTTLIIVVVVLLWNYKRRLMKQKMTDSTYSTLNRRTGQLQSVQCDSPELYDQIHLSPSTGQTEFIPKPQSENVNNPLCNSYPTHPDIEYSVINSNEATQTQATYAVIDKNKKKKEVSSTSADKGAHAGGKDDPTKRRQKSLSDMYASDHKDRKKMNSKQESNPPPPVEELYAAVKNKPAGSSVSVNEPVSQTAEDLYTAVMKKPKESSVNDEVVPSIPPHTTEKLYTAVQKKPKGNTMENEEKAPPIPPHTVEDTY